MVKQARHNVLYFVEQVTLPGWLFALLPRLALKQAQSWFANSTCYLFDAGLLPFWAARVTAGLINVRVRMLKFKNDDVVDENGTLLRLKLHYHDWARVLDNIAADHDFKRIVDLLDDSSRLPLFLYGSLAAYEIYGQNRCRYIWNALMVIMVASWKSSSLSPLSGKTVLFLEKRPWMKYVSQYALKRGLEVAVYADPFKAFDPQALRKCWRYARQLVRGLVRNKPKGTNLKPGKIRLLTEYSGHLHLNNPEQISNLFFYQQSGLSGDDIVILFNQAQDLLDGRKYSDIRSKGLDYVLLRSGRRTGRGTKVFSYAPGFGIYQDPAKNIDLPRTESRWLRERLVEYRWQRDYWARLFAEHNVKMFVSWFKYNFIGPAIFDALDQLGGIYAMYQRSYEGLPTPETIITADVEFGFSKTGAELAGANGSHIPYYIVTGYNGDHRFPLLRPLAKDIREKLMRAGAKYIVAYFDENTVDDDRWFTSHTTTQSSYGFILKKVIDNPWLGLIVKPKTPVTLKRRLGEVADLLERAKNTGRCYVFETGAIQGDYPPSAAALGADLAVHESLSAGTAGFEAALSGTKTVLLDFEGHYSSPFYRLEKGRVVFSDWDGLWARVLELFLKGKSSAGFGDWSPILDELDPFRDGRAAERMGTYLKWLLDGLNDHRPKESILAEAAERYAKQWGRDKVLEVKGKL